MELPNYEVRFMAATIASGLVTVHEDDEEVFVRATSLALRIAAATNEAIAKRGEIAADVENLIKAGSAPAEPATPTDSTAPAVEEQPVAT
jgi:hypothetical protein